ncbi:MAG TPA: ROK family protein [Bryobacteraceae bacterium]|jgi:predicted NBD/HSP70 family sugar kinase|nr:ROK family protein [Bryobacteraceae bacterium]
MESAIGVLVAERIAGALVIDHKIASAVQSFPEHNSGSDALQGMPSEIIVRRIVDVVKPLLTGSKPSAIGLGFPGIMRNGVIEDSPNLLQLKGVQIQNVLREALAPVAAEIPVAIFNDADVVAAGLAATRGHLDRLIRVWTLGNGIGFGRYPFQEGIWEGGHLVVTLDPREHFCGCGGKGHLEGIMGQRAMRLRFMDLEPEEVFEHAKQGDRRCIDFVKLWHRALAAASANCIHLEGCGKFFITGMNSKYLNVTLLGDYLHEMVKLTPLQGYSLEIVPGGEEIALIGAAVNGLQSVERS